MTVATLKVLVDVVPKCWTASVKVLPLTVAIVTQLPDFGLDHVLCSIFHRTPVKVDLRRRYRRGIEIVRRGGERRGRQRAAVEQIRGENISKSPTLNW